MKPGGWREKDDSAASGQGSQAVKRFRTEHCCRSLNVMYNTLNVMYNTFNVIYDTFFFLHFPYVCNRCEWFCVPLLQC